MKSKKQYGREGQYYRKRITRPDGKTEDVYGRTVTELTEKVIQRKAELLQTFSGQLAGASTDNFQCRDLIDVSLNIR